MKFCRCCLDGDKRVVGLDGSTARMVVEGKEGKREVLARRLDVEKA